MIDLATIRRIDDLVRRRAGHPSPSPQVCAIGMALSSGLPWEGILSLLAQAGLREIWGGTAITELLIVREIVRRFDAPAAMWVAYRAAYESVDAPAAIAAARNRCLETGEPTASATFDPTKNAWELYVALERTEHDARGLAVEIRNPFDFRDMERVLTSHELPRGWRIPGEVVTRSLPLPALLGDVWKGIVARQEDPGGCAG